jgi:RNA polymerase sigma factor (TIGR02999 family)
LVRAESRRKRDQECLESGPQRHILGATTVQPMSTGPRGELTNLLVEWGRGSQPALDRLLPYVYDELRTLARSHLRRERPGHTVQTGTLVHEAFVRLIEGRPIPWEGRAHFFGIAARLMRQILVDHARARDAAKRGAGEVAEPIATALSVAVQTMDVGVIALDRALDALAAIDPDQARVVELRFFGGLTVEETAEVMGVSAGTVKREWSMARAWLRRAVAGEPGL